MFLYYFDCVGPMLPRHILILDGPTMMLEEGPGCLLRAVPRATLIFLYRMVVAPMASYECHRTMSSGREPQARSHTLRVDWASRSDTTSNVKVVQIVYCS